MASSEGKLFVGQVPAVCTEAMLRPLFAPYGTLVEIKIMRDPNTGRSRGCAWVRYSTRAEAQLAIDSLDGQHTIPPHSSCLQVRFAADGRGDRQRGHWEGQPGLQGLPPPPPPQHAYAQSAAAMGAGQWNPQQQQSPQQQGTLYASQQYNPFSNIHQQHHHHHHLQQQSSPHGTHHRPFGHAAEGPSAVAFGGQSGGARPPSETLFCGNLPPELPPSQFDVFIRGQCQTMQLPEPVSTRPPQVGKRFGFAVYSTPEEATLVLGRLNGCQVLGSNLVVEYATQRRTPTAAFSPTSAMAGPM